MVRLRPENARDRLISLVRYGKVTPEQAAAEARARGWPPFERKPHASAFDPMKESRWSLAMAIAWIAWRDLELTREQSVAYRSECTHWIFREWSKPTRRGTAFVGRAGWFLEAWSPPTAVRLSLLEAVTAALNELPATRRSSVSEAEAELWQALSDGLLIAEGMNDQGRPIEIPPREWTYLKLFEERAQDVLKYEALDQPAALTRVQFKRDDVLRLWPEPTSTVGAEQRCYRWLKQQMRASLSRRPKSSQAFWLEAKRQWPTLARKQFLRAWPRAIADTGANWSKPGRPKSKPSGS